MSLRPLTISNILTLQNLKSFTILQGSLNEERNSNASHLNGALADSMDHRWRNNSSENFEYFLSCQDGSINIAMVMVLEWERCDFDQICNIVVDLIGRLTCKQSAPAQAISTASMKSTLPNQLETSLSIPVPPMRMKYPGCGCAKTLDESFVLQECGLPTLPLSYKLANSRAQENLHAHTKNNIGL